jgi:hypothetical protein
LKPGKRSYVAGASTIVHERKHGTTPISHSFFLYLDPCARISLGKEFIEKNQMEKNPSGVRVSKYLLCLKYIEIMDIPQEK